jgi:hypothetical protein
MSDDKADRGLTVGVFRAADNRDCTNGGASSKVTGFTVIGAVHTAEQRRDRTYDPLPRDARVFGPTDDSPAAVLVLSNLGGAPPHLVPLEAYLSGKWTMAGGNLADHTDGRWADLVRSFQPRAKEVRLYLGSTVDIHDRIEN